MVVCLQHSLAIGRYWAEAARYVADSLILPLSTRSYASGLYQLISDLEAGYGNLMLVQGITLGICLNCIAHTRIIMYSV
jgi:hypothetical protein